MSESKGQWVQGKDKRPKGRESEPVDEGKFAVDADDLFFWEGDEDE